MSFIHLNVASGYSLKYGTTQPRDLVARAAEFEMPALALTDRDGLAGAIRFAQSCIEYGIAPIIGINCAIDLGDTEGRVIVTQHGELTCINTYLPSGSNKEERQAFKEAWMDEWRDFLRPYLSQSTPVVVCGDLNIAHTEDDIWNPKGNAKSSGFLPHEREWFTELLNDGWHDVLRQHVGEGEKIFSWWSNRGQARIKDRGWRIDYFLLNDAAAERFESIRIERQGGLDVSDHAPVILDLKD